MKMLPSSQPEETIMLKVEQTPVWEVILGITAFTHIHLQEGYDLDKAWLIDESSMPTSLIKLLNQLKETSFWHGLILLQAHFSAATVQEFIHKLTVTPMESLLEILLPYKNRQSESMRKLAILQSPQSDSWSSYAALFKGYGYLAKYIHHLQSFQIQEVSLLLINTLKEWEAWISQRTEWQKWLQVLAYEQKQNSHLDNTNPIAEIERVTGGVEYVPEFSIWRVKLIPQISCGPWALTTRTSDTKFIFYPLKEEYLLEPEVPPSELIHGHKALGDEVRLKLLFQLKKSSLSLQELGIHFNIPRSTLHHHLTILKEAKFIFVEKGNYSINYSKIDEFSSQLKYYLEDPYMKDKGDESK